MYAISERILLTLWIGGMWITGYVVAPTLFTMLDDRMLAGKLAGQLFTIMSYIGIVAAAGLLAAQFMQASTKYLHNWRIWTLLIMLILILLGQFVLQPMMAELKNSGLVTGSDEAQNFARLHGLASMMFLINSLLGMALVVFGLHKQQSN